MSYNTELQSNNADLQAILDAVNALPEAGGGESEDVTDETNEYTAKLETLESAISALETELEGKASGGMSVDTCVVTVENYHSEYDGEDYLRIAYTNKQLNGVVAYLPAALMNEETYETIAPSITDYTVAKGTIFFCASVMDADESYLGDCIMVCNAYGNDNAIVVNSDCILVLPEGW